MPGLDPGIHPSSEESCEGMDHRVKPGDDALVNDGWPDQARPMRSDLAEAEQLEQRREVAEFLARGRRGAADEVEDLAVLQSVIGQPLHLAVLVEVDRDHPLV